MAWLGIGFVIVFATYLGYLLISFGLRRLSPTIVSTYTYINLLLQPIWPSLMGQDHIDFVMVFLLYLFLQEFLLLADKKTIIKFLTGNEKSSVYLCFYPGSSQPFQDTTDIIDPVKCDVFHYEFALALMTLQMKSKAGLSLI